MAAESHLNRALSQFIVVTTILHEVVENIQLYNNQFHSLQEQRKHLSLLHVKHPAYSQYIH